MGEKGSPSGEGRLEVTPHGCTSKQRLALRGGPSLGDPARTTSALLRERKSWAAEKLPLQMEFILSGTRRGDYGVTEENRWTQNTALGPFSSKYQK